MDGHEYSDTKVLDSNVDQHAGRAVAASTLHAAQSRSAQTPPAYDGANQQLPAQQQHYQHEQNLTTSARAPLATMLASEATMRQNRAPRSAAELKTLFMDNLEKHGPHPDILPVLERLGLNDPITTPFAADVDGMTGLTETEKRLYEVLVIKDPATRRFMAMELSAAMRMKSPDAFQGMYLELNSFMVQKFQLGRYTFDKGGRMLSRLINFIEKLPTPSNREFSYFSGVFFRWVCYLACIDREPHQKGVVFDLANGLKATTLLQSRLDLPVGAYGKLYIMGSDMKTHDQPCHLDDACGLFGITFVIPLAAHLMLTLFNPDEEEVIKLLENSLQFIKGAFGEERIRAAGLFEYISNPDFYFSNEMKACARRLNIPVV